MPIWGRAVMSGQFFDDDGLVAQVAQSGLVNPTGQGWSSLGPGTAGVLVGVRWGQGGTSVQLLFAKRNDFIVSRSMLRMGRRPLGKGNTMDIRRNRRGGTTRRWSLGIAAGLILGAQALASPGTENGAWTFIGGDSAHPFHPSGSNQPVELGRDRRSLGVGRRELQRPDGRSTPTYVDGILYRRRGPRRHVAMDPKNGETLWSYREPHTFRYEYSMRKDYGKGVAYAEVDGKGVIYIASPGFFLTALDAKTGKPLEGFGHAPFLWKGSRKPGSWTCLRTSATNMIPTMAWP